MNGTILGRWYAEPLTPPAAEALLTDADRRRRNGRRSPCHVCGLMELVARYWLGQAVDPLYQDLQVRLRRTTHGRALLELMYGQLLASRRLAGAFDHLDQGFEIAHRLFTPGDYLTVMNRHQRLRALPLSTEPLPPEPLEGLLVLAEVVRRLGTPSHRGPHDPTDIYG